MRPRKISDEQRARIIRTVLARRSLPSDKQLAAESGVSVSAIRRTIEQLLSEMTVSCETIGQHDSHA